MKQATSTVSAFIIPEIISYYRQGGGVGVCGFSGHPTCSCPDGSSFTPSLANFIGRLFGVNNASGWVLEIMFAELEKKLFYVLFRFNVQMSSSISNFRHKVFYCCCTLAEVWYENDFTPPHPTHKRLHSRFRAITSQYILILDYLRQLLPSSVTVC